MRLFPYPSLIGSTFVRQCAFLFAFKRNEHVRGEWVRKSIQPGLFHDQVKIAQGCAHDLERTLSLAGVSRVKVISTMYHLSLLGADLAS